MNILFTNFHPGGGGGHTTYLKYLFNGISDQNNELNLFIAAPKLLEFDLFIIFQRLIFSIFFAFIILEQSYCDNSILKFSRIRFFDFFGKISFGLYCYHGIVITIILNFNYNDSLVFNILVYPILIFILTLLVSYVSYRFYETKFLKLKSKFSLSN